MRDHHSLSPAVSTHQTSFPGGSHRAIHHAIVRWLRAALLAVSALALPTAPAPAWGIGAPATLPASQTADDHAKTDTPHALQENNSLASRFGLAFRTSTLGLGADAGFRVARPVNVRVGFNAFHYARSLTKDGTPYQGSLHLRSMETVVDWFPFAHSFHVGSGLLFLNGNRVTAVATPPVGQVLTAGAQAYVSDPQNPLTSSAKSATKRIAPVAMVGFGNLVPRHRHFAYSVDLGVVFQGVPKSTFTLAGGACDPSGEFCARAAEDSSIQAEAQSARTDLAHHVSFLKYYPVISVEFGYRF